MPTRRCRVAAGVPCHGCGLPRVCRRAAQRRRAGRRAAAIAAQHRQHGLAPPASDPSVTTLLRQARRTATRRHALPPAGGPSHAHGDCLPRRSRWPSRSGSAAAGCRRAGRAALVGLDAEQFASWRPASTSSSTPQRGAERTVAVRRVASLRACPVRALKDWMEASDSRFGPVFRKVDRWGNVDIVGSAPTRSVGS